MVAFTGPLRVICTVSAGSSRASSITPREMDPAVSPSVKVRVPEARVKSVPEPVAEPPVTA